jgi:hypothetical protein
MSVPRVAVIVQSDGSVVARLNGINGGERQGRQPVGLSGLDGRLVRLFETWMTSRGREWTHEEVRAFGQLLHRTLFPENAMWAYVKEHLSRPDPGVVRLMLAFPKDGAAARLAAFPWEYLHTPEDEDGRFLAEDERVVLSRVVPSGVLDPYSPPASSVRILPVVSDADPEGLGEVDAEPVLEVMAVAAKSAEFDLRPPLTDVTRESLTAGVAEHRPDLLHFMGHGRFKDGVGGVALRDRDGERVWVDEFDFAEAICAGGTAPSVVVLHTCESGMVDFDFRFAGLAPELVRRGVKSVVAMQYAVTNATAGRFSAALYAALAEGRPVDVAAQAARRELVSEAPKDYRLLGIPMIYLRNAQPLLGGVAE